MAERNAHPKLFYDFNFSCSHTTGPPLKATHTYDSLCIYDTVKEEEKSRAVRMRTGTRK